MRPRLALVPGEPAGIGPELVVRAAQERWDADLTVFGDAATLHRAAKALRLPLHLHRDGDAADHPLSLPCVDVANTATPPFGMPDPRNAAPVIESLTRAAQGCLDGRFDGLVTGPCTRPRSTPAASPTPAPPACWRLRPGASP